MASTFDVTWSVPLTDYSATPITDIRHLTLTALPFGSFFVLELTRSTWETLLENPQVLGSIRWSEKLEDIFEVDNVSIGDKDVLYVFGKGI